MNRVSLYMDGKPVQASAGTSLLEVAWQANIYIPQLCAHPAIPFSIGSTKVSPPPAESIFIGGQPFYNQKAGREYEGCGLCLISIEGREEFFHACTTPSAEGMKIWTDTPALRMERQKRLSSILTNHPHACLTCAQNRGCSLTQCSSNVHIGERCCPVFQECELRKVAEYVGIPPDTPRYIPKGLPAADEDPLILMDFNLCISCLRCVRICADVRGVGALGYIFQDGKVLVGSRAPTLRESACRFCLSCVEVCPTGALRDKKSYTREVPCQSACPVGMDVPSYIRAIALQDYPTSVRYISGNIPLTSCLSRVCHHPCESVCLRNELDEAVAICGLKRFALEQSGRLSDFPPPSENGKKIAIIGSGPAGLSAGYYLRKKGYDVTVFEKEPSAGGMLRMGIPRFRLPEEILQKDLTGLQNMGIKIHAGVAIDNPASLLGLKEQGYHAIFIGTGAGLAKKISLPGVENEEVFWGLDFLKNVAAGFSPDFRGKKVVVIGGGNVAMDVALTARRFGASSVSIVCLERRDEMPAFEKEIANAIEEGIVLHPNWGPRQILCASGKVTGVEFILCTRVFDEEKRFNPSLDESTTMTLPADVVILAIGQAQDLSHFPKPVLNTMGRVSIDPASMQTSIPGIFAGGEAVKSPSSVVEAIADGRKAAEAIDLFLGGDGILKDGIIGAGESRFNRDLRKAFKGWLGKQEGFAQRQRENMPVLPLNQRQGFDEIALGFTEEMALREATRCLQCDLRVSIPPVPLPPPKFYPFNDESIRLAPEMEGVIQLLNEKMEVVLIKGTPNINTALREHSGHKGAKFFLFELHPMFTQRESELLQEHLKKFGTLPQEDLEDLF